MRFKIDILLMKKIVTKVQKNSICITALFTYVHQETRIIFLNNNNMSLSSAQIKQINNNQSRNLNHNQKRKEFCRISSKDKEWRKNIWSFLYKYKNVKTNVYQVNH
ncbi:hypothetical protein BpHYR1_004887 [Brachionus plicatilis]|uniref:Uncharacterized protein n=1 Tax=Brachionus plicatilis TaxID=10195 RepID=A0A3M7RR90_BRAPC|nr:hypothetical protein BpHYR1_004887 [Brachionus plicatilis]